MGCLGGRLGPPPESEAAALKGSVVFPFSRGSARIDRYVRPPAGVSYVERSPASWAFTLNHGALLSARHHVLDRRMVGCAGSAVAVLRMQGLMMRCSVLNHLCSIAS